LTSQHGINVRLARIIGAGGPSLVAALDDGYFSGPTGRLKNPTAYVAELMHLGIDRFLGFSGFIERYVPSTANVVRIVNATVAGVTCEAGLRLPGTPLREISAMGADGVLVHVSLCVPEEMSTLATLAEITSQAHELGLPVIAAMYDRSTPTRADIRQKHLVQGARIAVELGADSIKLSYTTDSDGFGELVESASPVPVFVAGGALVSDDHTLSIAAGAAKAGAAGYFLGRSLSGAENLPELIERLKDHK